MKKYFDFDRYPMHRYNEEYASLMTRKCRCGHSVTIYNRFRREICSNCGRYVYLTKRDEFKHNMQRKMIT